MKKEVVYRITRTQYKKLEVETKEQEELVKELNRDFERESQTRKDRACEKRIVGISDGKRRL